MKNDSKIRTFIAIEIPETIQKKIGELQNSLKAFGARISWTRSANIHLTLKFLGDTEAAIIDEIAARLQLAVANLPEFKIAVNGTGAFPNFKRPRVIWIGAASEGDQLQTLAARVDECMENFGFETEKRHYSAHLTLGRVKDVSAIEPLMAKLKSYENFQAGSFNATNFHLIKSELHPAGSIYSRLKTITLHQGN